MVNIIDIPSSMHFEALNSPHYRLEAPELRNVELLPKQFGDFYLGLWNKIVLPWNVTCSVIPSATVDGPGLVYDRDLNLLRETIHQTSQAEIDGYTWGVGQALQNGGAPFRDGVTLLCEKTGVGNYGHWLIEMLPVVWAMRSFIQRWGWKVRLPVAGPAMNSVMRKSIEMLGVPPQQIVSRIPGPETYERLVVVSDMTTHGARYSPLVTEAAASLSASVSADAPARIWVSRQADARRFVNEDEIVEILSSEGWRIIDPRNLSLHEQIAAFKEATQIGGVAGAGLTNLVFAPAETPVTVFTPSLMPDIFYWTLSNHKQQRYRDVRCKEDREMAPQGNWDAPIRLDIQEIQAALFWA